MKMINRLALTTVLVLAAFLSMNGWKAEASSLEIGTTLDSLLEKEAESTAIEAIITYESKPSDKELEVLKSHGLSLKTFSELPMVGVKGTALEINDLINSGLDALSIYANEELDYYLRDSRELIGAESVWTDLGYTGAGTTVAVIDSGIDATHPDLPLGSKVVQNVQLLVGGSIFGSDDVYVEDVQNTDTSSGHGTHVAGTIAGLGEASDGLYKGVAPDAQLVGIGAGEGLSILWALEGFNYVMEHQEEYGIDVISNSWGTTGEYSPNNPINVASKMAHDNGMIVTFAAGNAGPEDNTLNPYSAAPWVISVAAGTKDKELADFSSRGVAGDEELHPDITAPGVDIVAAKSSTGIVMNTLGTAQDLTYIETEHLPYYTTASGTSMATPHISGVLALMREAKPELHPDLALEILEKTAEPMTDYDYHEVGAGYVDAYQAVEKAEKTQATKGKYKEKETGKTYETYFVEQTWEGTVGPGVKEVEAESHDYYTFELGKDVVSVEVGIEWTSPANDLDLYVRDQEGALVGSSGNAVSTTESTKIEEPEQGTYSVDTEGWLNTVENYQGHYVVEKILK